MFLTDEEATAASEKNVNCVNCQHPIVIINGVWYHLSSIARTATSGCLRFGCNCDSPQLFPEETKRFG